MTLTTRTLVVYLGITFALFLSHPAIAQNAQTETEASTEGGPSEMSVEELEAYLEEQRQALEDALENQRNTEAKAQEVREALANQESRNSELEERLRVLCQEQEELNPGSLEDCLKQLDN